jgi:hypothetical protein
MLFHVRPASYSGFAAKYCARKAYYKHSSTRKYPNISRCSYWFIIDPAFTSMTVIALFSVNKSRSRRHSETCGRELKIHNSLNSISIR